MRTWKDADGKEVTDDAMYAWLDVEHNKLTGDYELIVGTDSHLHSGMHRFITVVCIYRKGRGGFYYYTTSEQSKREYKGTYPVKVKQKLFHETTLAIELATEIQEKTGLTPVVHIDASPPGAGELTSMFSDQLRGYVSASGFEGVLKDWAFVASGIANKHSKK